MVHFTACLVTGPSTLCYQTHDEGDDQRNINITSGNTFIYYFIHCFTNHQFV